MNIGKGSFLNGEIKAIFFDIGGTLVAKTRYAERDSQVINDMVTLLHLDCPPAELVEKINHGQHAYKTWCEQTLNELSVEEKWTQFLLPDLDHELVMKNAQKLQQLWRVSKGNAHVKSTVLPVLSEIDRRGYLLGTISHSTPMYLDEPGIADLLKVRIHTPEFGKRKPHPSLFVDAARRCGLDPADCAYVGDNPWRDVVGPREAGYGRVILVKNGGAATPHKDRVMQPDLVIKDLEDLLEVFPRKSRLAGAETTAVETRVMYDAALSTMWWNKETVSADEFFSTGRGLGFARFELNHQIPPEVLQQVDIDRFSIGSLHDPCPAYIHAKVLEQTDIQITSLDEERRRKGVDVVKGTIDQACRMGCRLVVIHPGRIICDHSMDEQLRALYRAGSKGTPDYEELRRKVITDRASRSAPHLDKCLESLCEIVAFAADTGVMLGLENRFHFYELPVFEELRAMLNEFKQPWVGWQFDIGHLQVHDQLGLLIMKDWLEQFSQRIVGLHWHDVIGIQDHQAPGTGDVDFAMIAKFLPPDCYHTLEVDKALSRETVAQGMRHLEKSGCIKRI